MGKWLLQGCALGIEVTMQTRTLLMQKLLLGVPVAAHALMCCSYHGPDSVSAFVPLTEKAMNEYTNSRHLSQPINQSIKDDKILYLG